MSAGYFSFFLMEDGKVKAVGQNDYMQLSIINTDSQTIIQTLALDNVKQIEVGIKHSVFLFNDGTVKSAGWNVYGQLGNGTSDNSGNRLVNIALTGVKQVACGDYHTMFLMQDGTVKGVGNNTSGQLGIGNRNDQSSIQTITGLTNVKQIICNNYQTFFVFADGTIKACGKNNSNMLGIGADVTVQTTPAPVLVSNVKQVAAGAYNTMFLLNDGKVKAVGDNGAGDLGLGNETAQTSIIDVPIEGVKQISRGQSHTLFLMLDGTVKSVGINSYGQLGINSISSQTVIQSIAITGVKEVVGGYAHSYFIMNDGTMKACGHNAVGQLGFNNTNGPILTPQLSTLSGVKKMQGVSANTIKYLIQDGSSIKTYINNTWTTLGASPLVKSYLDQGMTSLASLTDTTLSQLTAASPELLAWYEEDEGAKTLTMAGPIWEEVATSLPTPEDMALKGMLEIKDIPAAAWQALGGDFEVITHTNVLDEAQKVYLEAMPKSQLVKGSTDFTNVAQFALVASTGVKVIASSDSGATWLTMTNGVWTPIEATVDAVKASGMSVIDFNLVTVEKWALLKGKVRLAYLLEGEAILDKITVTKVQVTDSTPSIDSMQVQYEELTLAGRLKDLERLNAINLAKLNFKANTLLVSDAYKLDDMVVDTFEKDSVITTASSIDETAEQAFSATSTMGDGFYSEVTIDQTKTVKGIVVK